MRIFLKPQEPELVAFLKRQGKWLILAIMAIVLIFVQPGPGETTDAVHLRRILAAGLTVFCGMMALSNWRDWRWQHVSGFQINWNTFQLLVRGATPVNFANLEQAKFELDTHVLTYTLKGAPDTLCFMDLTAFDDRTLNQIFCYFKDAKLLYKFRLQFGSVEITQS